MFIKNNIFFIIITSCLYCFTNFFYVEGDWYVLKNPGQIQTITDDNYRIIIGADNGLFTYDKVTHELIYDIFLMNGLPSQIIKHVYYDNNTDHIWVVHDEGVSFKPLSSFSYRHLSNSDLIDKGIIDDIGSSSGFIWIRNYQHIVPLNSFSGKFVNIDEAIDEKNDIKWGSSMYGFSGENIDISKFYISDVDFSIGYRLNNINNQYLDHNVFFDKYGDQIIPTVFFIDNDNNYWIGTDRGFLFYGWRNSRKLEFIYPILKKGIISDAYLDQEKKWWFFDSEFKRTGNLKNELFDYFNGDDDIFLIFWDEDNGYWERFNIDESINIKSTDINDVIRLDDYLIVATTFGLLKYNLNNSIISSAHSVNNKKEISGGAWELLDLSDGLYDNAIWKLVKYKKKIIAMASNGINEINLEPFKVIPGNFEDYINNTFYDIAIYDENPYYICEESDKAYHDQDKCISLCDGSCSKYDVDKLFLATNRGIKEIDLIENNETILSNKVCYQMKLENENLYCLDHGILKLNIFSESANFEQVVFDDYIRNFELCDHYIWINLIDRARLINMNNGESWYYNQSDGIQGNEIYNIGCDDQWVWFLAREGISLFNWGKYHDN